MSRRQIPGNEMSILDEEAVSNALLVLNDLDLEESGDADLVRQVLARMSFDQVKILAVSVDALAALIDDIAFELGPITDG